MKRYYLPTLLQKLSQIVVTLLAAVFLLIAGALLSFWAMFGFDGCGIEDTCAFHGSAYILVYYGTALLFALTTLYLVFLISKSSFRSYRHHPDLIDKVNIEITKFINAYE